MKRSIGLLIFFCLTVYGFGCDRAPSNDSRQPASTHSGRFEAPPADIEPDRESQYFVLKEDFKFIDVHGNTWLAPAGTKTDGATIPQVFLPLIGDRFDPKYRHAALVHDAYCQKINKNGASYHKRSWEEVHSMFYDASIADGTDNKMALLMFAAVWLGGPRWDDETRSLDNVPLDLKKEEFRKCQLWMEKKERTKQNVIDWMTKREPQLQQGVSPPLPDNESQ